MARSLRTVAAAVAALAALLPAPVRAAAVPVVVVDGRGFGHGVGMAQDGALWMGRDGASTEQILGQFYPGTSLGTGRGEVVVVVADAGPPAAVTLAFPNGGEVRDARGGSSRPGFPVRVAPGGQVVVTWDGGRHVVGRPAGGSAAGASEAAGARGAAAPTATATATGDGIVLAAQAPELPTSTTTTTSTTSTTAPPSTTTTTMAPLLPGSSTTTTTAPPGGDQQPPSDGEPPGSEPPAPGPTTTVAESPAPVWAVPDGGGTVALPFRQRRYRGVLEAGGAGDRLRVRNHLDVEAYLKGMGEVRDSRWPAASLRAQAIAARTYALRAMAVGGEICDTQRCQVYLGAQAEYGAMNAAVDATRGQVLGYRGRLISAVYSANGGGHSASREEGFGTTGADLPYLRPAPYLTRDPLPWTVTVALHDVAARLGYRGELTSVTVAARGPSGRATQVRLDGSAGPKDVTGIVFDAALGLRSTLFELHLDEADVAPDAPPADDDVAQVAPELAAAVVAPAAGPVAAVIPDLPAAPDDRRSRIIGPGDRAGAAGAGGWRGPLAGLAALAVVAVVAAAAAAGRLTEARGLLGRRVGHARRRLGGGGGPGGAGGAGG